MEELGKDQECHSRAKGIGRPVYQMLTYEVGSRKLGAEVTFWYPLWQMLNP